MNRVAERLALVTMGACLALSAMCTWSALRDVLDAIFAGYDPDELVCEITVEREERSESSKDAQ